ncbi:O-antigen acetylase, partial [hydrothermal vent metagenome]
FSPTDLERLGQSLQYAIVSLSNFFFWTEAGYFNETSEFKPLLHTWSLAIEEQYYLIWPTILVALSLIKKRAVLLVFLLVAMIGSLLLNYIYIKSSPSAVFFLLPFRVFEFAMGGLCVLVFNLQYSHKVLNEVGILTGLGLIVWSVLVFDQSTVFPGFAALLPCVGAALIIISKQSLVAKYLLSNKGLLKIGLASYSIYLIHWPLFVFYKYWKFTAINLTETVSLIVASVVLGVLMWRFIEQPFRAHQQGSNNKPFWLKFVLLIAVVFSLGYITHKSQGFPQRYPTEYFMSTDEIKVNRDRYWEYFGEENKSQVKKPGQKNVIVMGNSHAVDLIYSLRENDADLKITFYNSWHQCYNFGTGIAAKDKETCEKRLSRHLKKKAWKSADVIYLHDHWPTLDLKGLEQRLLEIRGVSPAPIIIFGPKMTYSKRVPDIVLSHMRMSSINEFAKQFSHKQYLENLNRKVKAMVNDLSIEQVSYIDMLSIQCGDKIDQCEIVSKQNNQFLYFDFSHFTLQGAKEFGAKLKAVHPEVF